MTSRLLTSYAQSNAPPPGGGNGGGGGSGASTVTLSQQQPGAGAANTTNSAKAGTPPPGAASNGVGGNGKGLAGGSSSSSSAAKSDEQKRAGGNGGSGSSKSSVHTSSTAGAGNAAAGSGSKSADSKSAAAAGSNSSSAVAVSGSGSGSIPRDPSPYKTKTNARGEECVIIDVWAGNLKQELDRIMDIVDTYNHIAMDTEFPGVVARPLGCFKNAHDYHYQTLKCNVDLLKIIQLGLTFCNDQGQFLPGTCTWQFNFKFNLSEDMYAQDSIDMLTKSGIDFKEHDARGIDVEEFGELIMTSGIVLNEDVRWLSFHSGYDYGYLLKVLTCQLLPKEESDFFDLLRTYFPVVYDVKYLMKSCENLKGGLQKVAEDLQVERIGPQHQAGSDSLLTAATFFKIRSLFFENNIEDAKYAGVLYGLGQQLRSKKATVESDELAA